jgi:hypothetical protein
LKCKTMSMKGLELLCAITIHLRRMSMKSTNSIPNPGSPEAIVIGMSLHA